MSNSLCLGWWASNVHFFGYVLSKPFFLPDAHLESSKTYGGAIARKEYLRSHRLPESLYADTNINDRSALRAFIGSKAR